jgi:hypothetical protein
MHCFGSRLIRVQTQPFVLVDSPFLSQNSEISIYLAHNVPQIRRGLF